MSPYYEFNVTADDALNITRVWNQPYIVIHQANSLLERIESGAVATDNVTELNCIKAERWLCAGLALFDLYPSVCYALYIEQRCVFRSAYRD